MTEVELDGMDGDMKSSCDLRIRQPERSFSEDLNLAR
jgi:hypothetical protein